MDDEERQARADALRKEIAERGRTRATDGDHEAAGGDHQTIGGASEDAGRHDATGHSETRSDVQDIRGPVVDFAAAGRDLEAATGRYRNRHTGTGGLNRRSRSGGDGHRQSDLSAGDDHSAGAASFGESGSRTAGRLEADGEAPIRIGQPDAFFSTRQEDGAVSTTRYRIDYKPGFKDRKRVYRLAANPDEYIAPDEWQLLRERPEPEPEFSAPKPERPKEKLFGRSQVLTDAEIRELAEPLRETLQKFGEYADEGLWLLNPNEKGNNIWGDLTDDQAELLAKYLLIGGKQSPVIAVGIRQAVYWKDYAALAAILGPRIRKTQRLIETAPPRPKKKRSLFRPVEGMSA